jgi:hypothetical protein
MFSSLSTIQSFYNKIQNTIISVSTVVLNYYGLPMPTIYVPIRENSVANYVTGTADTTGISTSGGPTFTTGYVANSQAITFNNTSSQYLRLPNIKMTDLTCFSVSLWVKLANDTSNFGNIWCISNVEASSSSSTVKYTWMLIYRSADPRPVIRFEYRRSGTGNNVRRGKEAEANVDVLYHIVCIQRAANHSMDMYINNVKITSGLSGSLIQYAPQYGWTSTIHQCAKSSYSNDLNPYLNCTLDDFRFYSNIELSETDINKLYEGKNAPNDFIN